MKREDLSALTAQQKECLRLVAQHLSSKDIAKVLGTSPHTVDNHIKAAIQKLGVKSRREASRKYVEFERNCDYRELASQPPAIVKPGQFDPASSLPPEEVRAEVEADLLAFSLVGTNGRQAAVGAHGMIRLPVPRYPGDVNDLSGRQRALWAFLLMIASCLGVAATAAALDLLNRLI
jgi:DNA-binding CsgD family transcriptional regulator